MIFTGETKYANNLYNTSRLISTTAQKIRNYRKDIQKKKSKSEFWETKCFLAEEKNENAQYNYFIIRDTLGNLHHVFVEGTAKQILLQYQLGKRKMQ